MNDFGQWVFLVLLLLIAAPVIFWIVSLFIAWIKWLFGGKEKLEKSFSIMEDFKNPVSNTIAINAKLGENSNCVKASLLDVNFKEIGLLFDGEVTSNTFKYDLDTKTLGNGAYFLQLVTDNQKITKRIVVIN